MLLDRLRAASPTAGQIQRWMDALPEVPAGWSRELWVRTPRGWRVTVKEDRRTSHLVSDIA